MKRFIFYGILLKKAILLVVYNMFRQKSRISIRIRKSIENYLFFQPAKFRAVPIERYMLGKFRPVRFLTTDRVKIYAWFIDPKKDMPTILYLHGQAESILKHQNVARFCYDNGFGLFLLSYRGHYKSSGRPSEKGVYIDAKSAIIQLEKMGISSKKVIVWGHSLGTVSALEVASSNNIMAAILQSPIKNIKSASLDVCKFYARRLHLHALTLLNEQIILNTNFIQKFDAISKIKNVKCPVLILHSKTDRIAPYTNSVELANANNSVTLKIFDKGTHWDCAWCINSIFEFINNLGYNYSGNNEVKD